MNNEKMSSETMMIKKRGVYLKGHSYCTGFGYQFSWTPDINQGRRFVDASVIGIAQLSKGEIIKVESTKKELKRIGKIRMKQQESSHD